MTFYQGIAFGLLVLAGCGSAEAPGGGGGGGQGGSAGAGTGGVGGGGSDGAGGTPGGSSGAAGSGGNAGATGSGGTVGSAGTAGSAGAAGSAGTAGSAGAAGSAGTAGAPNEYFVGPSGVDTNPGTRQAPFKTLTRAHERALAGNTIWVLPGNYAYGTIQVLQKSGTMNSPIRIQAESARPVLDFASQPRGQTSLRGIEIRGDYWYIKGLEVKNAADNGIAISGSNNVVEDVVLHHNDDTGLQITVSETQATDNTRGANNLILNCDSFENFDAATNGENADGFAAKLRIGAGNVFRGCRAWNNADDGWDMFAADDVVVVEGSWAFLNGSTSRGSNPAGDGNGFKLGGRPAGPGQGDAAHRATNNSAFENQACGFTRNNNTRTPVVTQCGVGGNGTDYCDITCSSDYDVTMTGSRAKTIARNPDGSLPPTR